MNMNLTNEELIKPVLRAMSKTETRVCTSVHCQKSSFSLGLLLTPKDFACAVNSAQLPMHPEDETFFPSLLKD